MHCLGLEVFLLWCIQLCPVKGIQMSNNDDVFTQFDLKDLNQLEKHPFPEDTLDHVNMEQLYEWTDRSPTSLKGSASSQMGVNWQEFTNRIGLHLSQHLSPYIGLPTKGELDHVVSTSRKLTSLTNVIKLLQRIALRSKHAIKPKDLDSNIYSPGDSKAILNGRIVSTRTEGIAKPIYKELLQSLYAKHKQLESGFASKEQTRIGGVGQTNSTIGDFEKKSHVIHDRSDSLLKHILGEGFREETSRDKGMLGDDTKVADNGELRDNEELFRDDQNLTSLNDNDGFEENMLTEKPSQSNTMLNNIVSNYSSSDLSTDTNKERFSFHLGETFGGNDTDSHHRSSNDIDNFTADSQVISHSTGASERPTTGPTTTSATTTQEPGYHIDDLVDETPQIEFYRDICQSRNGFEIVTTAINDHLENVEVLPNTWVWSSKCVSSNQPCSSIGTAVKALCKQKKGWVQAFARLHSHDAWRWHWIAVDSGCSCGVKVVR